MLQSKTAASTLVFSTCDSLAEWRLWPFVQCVAAIFSIPILSRFLISWIVVLAFLSLVHWYLRARGWLGQGPWLQWLPCKKKAGKWISVSIFDVLTTEKQGIQFILPFKKTKISISADLLNILLLQPKYCCFISYWENRMLYLQCPCLLWNTQQLLVFLWELLSRFG